MNLICHQCLNAFATRIAMFLFLLNPKFQVSSYHLCLYSSVCIDLFGKHNVFLLSPSFVCYTLPNYAWLIKSHDSVDSDMWSQIELYPSVHLHSRCRSNSECYCYRQKPSKDVHVFSIQPYNTAGFYHDWGKFI